MSIHALARYVNTTTQRTNATNWTTDGQGYFDTARKTNPLVTHNVSGTPSVSEFVLNAPGSWLIELGSQFAQTATAYLCLNGVADANNMVGSGLVAVQNVILLREFDTGASIRVRWKLSTAGLMTQGMADVNHIAFAYLGAV